MVPSFLELPVAGPPAAGPFRVPFIDLAAEYRLLEAELKAAFERTAASGSFILRQDVAAFEAAVLPWCGARHAVALGSGTDALLLALKALGIGAGDEVITVAHTFVATVAAIAHCGATPVLVDIGEDFLMDPAAAAAAITGRTRAILPVHLNGRICDMEALVALARSNGIALVEDAAQALGARWRGRPAGSLGDAAAFSLHPMKVLGALGDGGFLATGSDEIHQRVRRLRNHGQQTQSDLREFGFCSRLDNLQAALLNAKLPCLGGWLAHRRALAARYHEGLSNVGDLRLPPPPFGDPDRHDIYASYVIRTDSRDALAAFLRARGIETFAHWPTPLHRQRGLGLDGFRLPVTEKASATVLSLPLHNQMAFEGADRVIDATTGFFEGERA